jgi:hypothetical protein
MALWFKNLFKRKRKQTHVHAILEFNQDELGTRMQKLSVELFKNRHDDSIKIVKAILETSRNIQILEINRFKSGDKLAQFEHQLGRLEVLNDLVNFISSSLDPDVYNERKEPVKQNVKVLKTSFERSQPVI